ncbi:HAMP domain-containing histidine kinase [bacterium]|jgi:signal transduction histidine kinase|nr:HAMP domain-containing histidine kinase [bacterium]
MFSALKNSVRSRLTTKFQPKNLKTGLQGLRFQLTLLFASIFGTTLIAFSVLLYQVFIQTHQREFDAALHNHAVDVSESLNVDWFGDLTFQGDALAENTKIFPFSLGQGYFEVRGEQGKPLSRSRNLEERDLPLDPSEIAQLLVKGESFRTVKLGEPAASFRLINYVFSEAQEPLLILQVAVPLDLLQRERLGLITFFILSIPLILVIAILAGFYVSKRALIPISTAFESQERFVADASHQLKTPLAILRGELDLMLSRERSADETRGFLKSASGEINYLSRMVEDLLVLARVDAGSGSLSINTLRLDETLIEAISSLEKLAATRGVKLKLNLETPGAGARAPYEVAGDADLLRSMLQSFIENALKYSPEGASVEVKAADHDREVSVSIQDQGPGIPKEALDKIFERFYRAEDQGREKIRGTGLGLAIARQIAEVHQATIEVQSEIGKGTQFIVRIKKF